MKVLKGQLRNGVNGTQMEAAPGRNGVERQDTPGRQQATVNNKPKNKKNNLKIGTWNVRTLAQSGKLENVKQEMDRMKVDLMGIAEMRWKGNGKLISNDHTVLYSGPEDICEKGVGLIMKNKLANTLSGHWPLSDRVIAAKFILCINIHSRSG